MRVIRAEQEKDSAGERVAPWEKDLLMPSALIRDHFVTAESELMEFEWEFRVAQAEESLDELRRKIILETYVLDYKKAYGHGQRQGTKSAKLLKDCQAAKSRCIATYQRARTAMEALSTRITRPGWRAVYQHLDADDTRPALTNNAEGEGRRKLSWIWMAPGTGKTNSPEHVQEGMSMFVLVTTFPADTPSLSASFGMVKFPGPCTALG